MDKLKEMIDKQIRAIKETADENGFREIKVTVTFEYTLIKPNLDGEQIG